MGFFIYPARHLQSLLLAFNRILDFSNGLDFYPGFFVYFSDSLQDFRDLLNKEIRSFIDYLDKGTTGYGAGQNFRRIS